MKHYLFTASILVIALALYSISLVSGALWLFTGGAVFELWFWARIFLRRRGPNHASKRTREELHAA
ncbi:MAG: hypothetical protein EPN56_08400 [Rhodanobacter sp.]|nr:MAG: hypothetical protein EPN78_07460 [Rhodanobacter sp.]TAM13647.1 MAG: hypothetical protein EPN66_05185 [Rhodanobacter sp.]TAM35599.1 MAG: hypothetical protein EPN56_08400 [Rhodanobacter sp.]